MFRSIKSLALSAVILSLTACAGIGQPMSPQSADAARLRMEAGSSVNTRQAMLARQEARAISRCEKAAYCASYNPKGKADDEIARDLRSVSEAVDAGNRPPQSNAEGQPL